MARTSDFITEAREANRKIWEGMLDLLALQNEWNALAYGDDAPAGLPDGTGANEGVTKAEVGAVVFDTANELKLRIIDTGHKTNMAKLL